MTKMNKFLQALNQTFDTKSGVITTVMTLQRAFDNATQERVIWSEYRVKADIFELVDFNDEKVKKMEPYVRRKRLIKEITRSALWRK
jgi:hypothetical protein